MLKVKVIRKIIKVSSQIQTSLLNYLDFNEFDPKDYEDRSYLTFKGIPKPKGEPEKPFQKEDVIKPDYSVLLELAEKRGIPIHPVCRRYHPLRSEEKCCRKCKAPQMYLTNHGFYTRKSTKEKFPKHTCKVCLSEYAPEAKRRNPKHICPFCGYAMNPEKYRKNFTTYSCRQKDCDHKKLHKKGYRYSEREWHDEIA